MSVVPTTEDLYRVITETTQRMCTSAREAGLGAPVPTCPEWAMADLVAHQGMVHRWARAQVLGAAAPFASEAEVLESVATDDLVDWLDEGSRDLLDTLRSAPADVEAWVFMETGLTPLQFWTRRQAHETTIHAVDAVAARVGSVPPAADLDIDPAFAADGLDELLVRFAPRGRSKLFDGQPLQIAVECTDGHGAWTLAVTAESLTVTDESATAPDARWSGTAVGLYLGLWNRGDEIATEGDGTTLARWRDRHRVR